MSIPAIQEIKGYITPLSKWDDSFPLTMYKEGTTSFYIPSADNVYDAPAFFNPVMVLNRDATLLFSKVFSEKMKKRIRFFEPLAGIGVRGLRMAHEIENSVEEIVINDFGTDSSKLSRYNRSILSEYDKVHQFKREARALCLDLAESFKKYHYIDLDPFGSPAPFIDFIWPPLARNGMVSVTATDMTALAGVFPDACHRKYGAQPLNNAQTHEIAVRILISLIVRSAARFEKGVKPIFSMSSDHYVKVFLLVKEGRGAANESVSQIQTAKFCLKCQNWRWENESSKFSCCGKTAQVGPLWNGNLYSQEWCDSAKLMLETINLPTERKLRKMLQEGTKSADLPFYYSLELVSSKLHTSTPPMKSIIEKLRDYGFRAEKTTFRKQALRTDAPYWIVEDTIRMILNK